MFWSPLGSLIITQRHCPGLRVAWLQCEAFGAEMTWCFREGAGDEGGCFLPQLPSRCVHGCPRWAPNVKRQYLLFRNNTGYPADTEVLPGARLVVKHALELTRPTPALSPHGSMKAYVPLYGSARAPLPLPQAPRHHAPHLAVRMGSSLECVPDPGQRRQRTWSELDLGSFFRDCFPTVKAQHFRAPDGTP